MKLRNRKSYMTSLPEGAPPKSYKPRITQLIYYAILLSVALYILYIFVSRFFYFNEMGFVEVDKTIISATYGGKILKLNLHEGQSINRNEIIAEIAASKDCSANLNNARENKLKYDLALNQSKLSLLKRNIASLQTRLNNSTLQRALETGQSLQSNDNKLKLELAKKQAETDLIESEIILQKQQLQTFKPLALKKVNAASCANETIRSPFNSTVISVQRKINEFTSRGAPLITLAADNATVRIEAYLKTDQRGYINKGDIVSVIFANNLETQAKISSIHSSAYNVPEREWDYYKPADTQLRVHLEPLNKQDAKLWKQYDRMEVAVRGRK